MISIHHFLNGLLDNEPPLPTGPQGCEIARIEMKKWHCKETALLQALSARNNGQPPPGILGHLSNCTSCQEWFKDEIGEQRFVRLQRAAEYCCMSMYIAVEESELASESAHWERREKVRGFSSRDNEWRWTIGPSNSYIFYCPWCGKHLPDEPF